MKRDSQHTPFGGFHWCFLSATVLALAAARSTAADVTAAAFGDIYDMSDGAKPIAAGGGHNDIVSGDSWYSTWGADDTAWLTHDDGEGFDHVGKLFARHRLCRLEGDPNRDTGSVRGVNLNPGALGQTLPCYAPAGEWEIGYTSSIIELDGVLYMVCHDWNKPPALWPPINSRIIKSPDGGKTWINHVGQVNAPLPGPEHAMFPRLPWSYMTFIQYGKGGAVPKSDNLDRFVYLAYGRYLARVPRGRLPRLDKADFQFYKGAGLDGMLDSSWSNDPDEGKPAQSDTGQDDGGTGNIIYDAALSAYIATRSTSYRAPSQQSELHPLVKTRLVISTAPHPWGPWRTILRQGIWGRIGWPLLLCNKFTTADGLKMWHGFSGEYKGDIYNYGFQYMPLYLSTGRVDTYEAEQAVLKGASVAQKYASFSGSGYAGGFAKPGDGLTFKIDNVNGTDWHIMRIRYTSPTTNAATMSVYVNGKKAKVIKLSLNNSDGQPLEKWIDRGDIYYLNDGNNTIELRLDEGDNAAGVLIDSIAVSAERTHDEGKNVAPAAKATASSGEAADAIKGYVDGRHEWTATGGVGEWIKLEWEQPQTLTKVVLYDPAARDAQVIGGTLSFSDGPSVKVGKLQNDGQAGTVVTFPPRRVTWMKFTVDAVSPGTKAAGLGEVTAM